jgi:hypothetical protein
MHPINMFKGLTNIIRMIYNIYDSTTALEQYTNICDNQQSRTEVRSLLTVEGVVPQSL